MKPEERKLLSIIRKEQESSGKCILPLKIYAEELGTTREDVRNIINKLIHDGVLKSNTAWIDGTKRWCLKIKRFKRSKPRRNIYGKSHQGRS